MPKIPCSICNKAIEGTSFQPIKEGAIIHYNDDIAGFGTQKGKKPIFFCLECYPEKKFQYYMD